MSITHITIGASAYVSYASEAQADAYLAVDPVRKAAWELLASADQKANLVAATRRLDLLTWQGTKTGVAFGTLTFTAIPADSDTVTIDAKVYTFQTTLTDVDGNVLIGVSATTARDNLIAAIILGTGAGTQYATSMTIHPTVTARPNGANLRAIAKTSGATGDTIATTETGANLSWGAVTLEGGLISSNQENEFARTGLVYPDGTEVSTTEAPIELENAASLLAGSISISAAVANLGSSGSNVKSVKAGSAAVEFFRQQTGKPLQDETAFKLIQMWTEAAATSSALGPLASGVDGESTFTDIDQWGRDEGFP